jgi:extracellular factor (EF) 3-hydroxypalmitic acid methyl ester biosynthesis protein
MVSYRNAQGVAITVPVISMSRHRVTFEVSIPQVVSRTSEVFNEFKITLHDVTVYSGRAVVASLINTATNLVCEVALEDPWQDAAIFAAAGRTANLREGFNQFLEQWQLHYRMRPELKVLIADMQVFLMDLRLWIEQVEFGLRSAPAQEQAHLEREAINQLAPDVVGALNALFEKFESVSLGVDEELKHAHHTYIKRHLHPLLLCSPFAYRTFNKPLGYAGDYEMVNMILRDPQEGASMFAKILNVWFISQPPAQAHRNRIKYLATKLVAETLRMKMSGRPARIFNLGCGPAQEVQNFLINHDICENAQLTLLDFNDETLDFTKQTLTELSGRYQRKTPIQFIKKSVVQMLKSVSKAAAPLEPKYDLVYCAGLFDYLPDKICKQLMNIFYDMVAPGGLLIATNVDRSNPIRQMLDYVLEWHLIYRNGRQMLSLRPDRADPELTTVMSDETSVNIYLEVRKPLA